MMMVCKRLLGSLVCVTLVACGGANDRVETDSVVVAQKAQTTPQKFLSEESLQPIAGVTTLPDLSAANRPMAERLAQVFDGRFASTPQQLMGSSAWAAWPQKQSKSSNAAPVPVFRFFHASKGIHFYTISTQEVDQINRNLPQYQYEGAAFFAFDTPDPSLRPVYRFFSTVTGTHFYTISAQERDTVRDRLAAYYRYEGTAWHAPVTPAEGTVPVHRFYNTRSLTHFYTTSESERQRVLAALPHMRYEGIAYYARANASQPSPPGPVPAPLTQADAARFLIQATYGPNTAEINRLAAMGAQAWMQEQFSTPAMDTHWDYAMVRNGPPGCTVCDSAYINAVMESFWLQAVRGPDQLRQRMVLALSEIFVVSNVNSTIDSVVGAHASYLDMLSRNAFGNYRQLLEQVATHPAMGHYLSHFRNEREDPATGRIPDENFAREVMQLFSIGLWQLHPDGTRRLDSSGNFIPTYDQNDVSGLARVFTGWSWGGPDRSTGRWHGWTGGQNWREQMQNYPEFHSRSEKRFLGVTIPANTSGEQSLRIALDTLFNHPNVGPFIGRQLIQRFVTSNPSPAYVGRVAAAFNNNGQGVRGDLRAVLRAVLLDPEARSPSVANQADWGKLREPMVRFANWMRAFDARSQHGAYRIWNLEDNVSSLGQNPLRAPSVFNWFRPDYAPPGQIMSQGMVAPEFQITHETTVTGYANFVSMTVERGHGWNEGAIVANYAPQVALASNPAALMDQLNLLLTAGRMTPSTRQIILGAIQEVPASQPTRRVHMAVALTMVSPEFIVQK